MRGHAVRRERMNDMGSADPNASQKLAIAFELFESGVDLMRQNLRRRHPAETPDEIEVRLGRWLATRPGAEHGDAVGRRREPGVP